MKWSWRLGKIAGIDVYIHATFFLLLVFLGVGYWQQTRSLSGTLEGLGFLLLVFASVVLHEYGHALAARRFGIQTRDITLLPIGGVARLERLPEKPTQELWVALAGPAVNVAIAFGLWLYFLFTQALHGLPSVTMGSVVQRLFAANLFLALFNLLPAFPMDGGRVLRAVLAMRGDYVQATQVAAAIGQGMAFLFGVAGLFGNPLLLFIALFVWIGAQQEAGAVQFQHALSGIPVWRAMVTDFRTLAPQEPLARAVELLLSTSQQDFPVVEDGQVVGLLTRSDLLQAVARHQEQTPVGALMRREFAVVHPNDLLQGVLGRLQTCECHTFPVIQEGKLVGLLTSENVGEFVMLQAARESARRGGQVPLAYRWS